MATSKLFDSGIDGLNDVLRALRKLPKEANKEMRQASKNIAERHMVPAWKKAALEGAGPWGEAIAGSVRAGADRVPKVMIGSNRKAVSGGASPTMLRYPTDKGNRARAGQGVNNRMPAAFGSGTNWISQSRDYVPEAIKEWGKAVDQIVMKWTVL